jgi:hypothetical protein
MDLQAMARVWRDGQKKPCVVYRLLTTGGALERGRWASGRLPGCLPACSTSMLACLPPGPGASNTAAALVLLPPATCHLPPLPPATWHHHLEGTLDEKIFQRQLKKGDIAATVLGGGGAGAGGGGGSKQAGGKFRCGSCGHCLLSRV